MTWYNKWMINLEDMGKFDEGFMFGYVNEDLIAEN